MTIAKIISTFFTIGYIGRGAGTVASVAICLLLYSCGTMLSYGHEILPVATIILFVAGVVAAGNVEKIWGKDNPKVVIDEVFGMMVTVLFLPLDLKTLLLGLFFFRFFDILKPLYIRKAEGLPGGWGVMADDFLAGVYANVSLNVLFFIF